MTGVPHSCLIQRNPDTAGPSRKVSRTKHRPGAQKSRKANRSPRPDTRTVPPLALGKEGLPKRKVSEHRCKGILIGNLIFGRARQASPSRGISKVRDRGCSGKRDHHSRMAQNSARAPMPFHGTVPLAYCPPESPMSPWASARREAAMRSISIPQRSLSPDERMKPLTLPVVMSTTIERTQDGPSPPIRQPLWVTQSQASPNLPPMMSPGTMTWQPTTISRRGVDVLPHKVPTGLRHSSLTPVKIQDKVERPSFQLPLHDKLSRGVLVLDAKPPVPPVAPPQYAHSWPSEGDHRQSQSPQRRMVPSSPSSLRPAAAGTVARAVTGTRLISSHTTVMPLGNPIITELRGSLNSTVGRVLYQEPSKGYVPVDSLSTARSPLADRVVNNRDLPPTQPIHQIVGVYNKFMQQQVTLLSHLYERLGELQRSLLTLAKPPAPPAIPKLVVGQADQRRPMEGLEVQPGSARPCSPHSMSDQGSSVEALHEGISQLRRHLSVSAETIRGRLEAVANEILSLKQSTSLDTIPQLVKQVITGEEIMDRLRSEFGETGQRPPLNGPMSSVPQPETNRSHRGPSGDRRSGDRPSGDRPPGNRPSGGRLSENHGPDESVLKLLDNVYSHVTLSTQLIANQLEGLRENVHEVIQKEGKETSLIDAYDQMTGLIESLIHGNKSIENQIVTLAGAMQLQSTTTKEWLLRLEDRQGQLMESFAEMKQATAQRLQVTTTDTTLEAIKTTYVQHGKEIANSITNHVSSSLAETTNTLLGVTEMYTDELHSVIQGAVHETAMSLTFEGTKIQKLVTELTTTLAAYEDKTTHLLRQTAISPSPEEDQLQQERLKSELLDIIRPLELSLMTLQQQITSLVAPVDELLKSVKAESSRLVESRLVESRLVESRLVESRLVESRLVELMEGIELVQGHQQETASHLKGVLAGQGLAATQLEHIRTGQEETAAQLEGIRTGQRELAHQVQGIAETQQGTTNQWQPVELAQQETVNKLQHVVAGQQETAAQLKDILAGQLHTSTQLETTVVPKLEGLASAVSTFEATLGTALNDVKTDITGMATNVDNIATDFSMARHALREGIERFKETRDQSQQAVISLLEGVQVQQNLEHQATRHAVLESLKETTEYVQSQLSKYEENQTSAITLNDEKRKKETDILETLTHAVQDITTRITGGLDTKLDAALEKLIQLQVDHENYVVASNSGAQAFRESTAALKEVAENNTRSLIDRTIQLEEAAERRIHEISEVTGSQYENALQQANDAILRMELSLNEFKEMILTKLNEKDQKESERTAKIQESFEALKANMDSLTKAPGFAASGVAGIDRAMGARHGPGDSKADRSVGWSESGDGDQWDSDMSQDSLTSTRRQIDLDNLQLRSLLENCVSLTESLKGLSKLDQLV